jgi:hypothetical protein
MAWLPRLAIFLGEHLDLGGWVDRSIAAFRCFNWPGTKICFGAQYP